MPLSWPALRKFSTTDDDADDDELKYTWPLCASPPPPPSYLLTYSLHRTPAESSHLTVGTCYHLAAAAAALGYDEAAAATGGINHQWPTALIISR